MPAPDKADPRDRRIHRVLVASSNEGKLREYRELASGSGLELELLPNLRSLPAFEELAPTFAENSAGKALHYGRYAFETLLAEDSGLVVPALGGVPGPYSARYAGPDATDEDRIGQLLEAMRGKGAEDRRARFVCVTTIAREGQAMAVLSDFADGLVAQEPRGTDGFGYDPIFFLPSLGRTFAEISQGEKNRVSHRGKAFRKVLQYFSLQNSAILR